MSLWEVLKMMQGRIKHFGLGAYSDGDMEIEAVDSHELRVLLGRAQAALLQYEEVLVGATVTIPGDVLNRLIKEALE